MRFAILPSPLLPAAGWDGVARCLVDLGHRAETLDARIPPSLDPAELVSRVAGALPADDVVLVPHSGAGILAPRIAAASSVVGTVFVDASLPAESGASRMAPRDLVQALAPAVDADGTLPPWTAWWGEEDLGELYPDAGIRRRVEDAAPRIPLAWLDARLEVPAGWMRAPAAYLAFGTAYAPELARAERQGWPVASIAGGHLHHLHDPAAVAAGILDLAERIRRA